MSSAAQKHVFAPGDLLIFSGRGFFSSVIRLATCSPYSHVGVCAEAWGKVYLFESTTLCDLPDDLTGKKHAGVQAHVPETRIAAYDGRVWRLPVALGWKLSHDENTRLSRFLLDMLRKPYDELGAILSPVERIRPEHEESFFCSELVAMGLQRVGRFPLAQPQQWTPGRLVREGLRLGIFNKQERLK